jgi:dipeptidyl aminopeptidase/acylaminoacyl peptidase
MLLDNTTAPFRGPLLRALIGLALLLPFFATAEPMTPAMAARKSQLSGFRLSPSGNHVAYTRVSDDDLMSLMVFDMAKGEQRGVAGTKAYEVGSYRWVNDRELVLTLAEDKIRTVGIYVYDVKKGRLSELLEFKTSNTGSIIMGVPRHRDNRVITYTPGEDGVIQEVTTKFNKKNRSFASNKSPLKRTYSPPEGRIRGYSADVHGEPAIGMVFEEGIERAYILNAKDESWTKIPLDMRDTPIMRVAADHQKAWIVKRTEDGGSALHTYDLVDMEWGPAVYSDPKYDLSSAIIYLDEDGQELQGVSYFKVRRESFWFDEKLQATYDRLAQALPQHDIVLASRTHDRTKALYVAVSSTDPGQYFHVDYTTDEIKHVSSAAPWLEGQPLSPVASFNFKARDGLEMQAYLTLPTDPNAKKPYPLMVLGHGGPWARDQWRYDGEVQFLASRGIAVLQPNYRGSTGFSYDISEKDKFDFRKMHNDVTDAVQKLVRGGYVNPDRIGIMGASFGGYLAIAGAAWEPDLYRVAITNVGVFDWELLMSDSRRESLLMQEWFKSNVGSDPEKLKAFSPIHSADNIRCPIFIAHGRQDIRVDISQSVRLERKLKSRRIPHETYYEGDSAHGFSAAEAQTEYLTAVDGFLQEHFLDGVPRVEVGDSEVVEMPTK